MTESMIEGLIDLFGDVDLHEQRAEYAGDEVTLGSDGPGLERTKILPMSELDFRTALFDLTDPFDPAILIGGVYACTASVECSGPLTDGGLVVILHVDHHDWDFVSEWTVPVQPTTDPILISPSFTGYCPAGGVIQVVVSNLDSVDHVAKLRELGIQRIT